jgi:predicted SAM-dependent methyltransferase
MKLHLGCGDVYLKDGFINIDANHEDSILVSSLSKRAYIHFLNYTATELDNYYSKPIEHEKGGIICDCFDDIKKLNHYKDNSVDTIVAFHVLEHFTFEEGKQVLDRWAKLLTQGGFLKVCVPDIMEICSRIINVNNKGTKNNAYRLLFGSHNRGADLDGHKSAWCLDTLKGAFNSLGMVSKILTSPTHRNYNPSLYIVGVKK